MIGPAAQTAVGTGNGPYWRRGGHETFQPCPRHSGVSRIVSKPQCRTSAIAQFDMANFLAAAWAGELRLQGFEGEGQMRRSMAGAALMGFGAMLAGGCAIGAGVTNGSIFVATAWLALLSMWVGAVVTDFLVDQAGARVRQ